MTSLSNEDIANLIQEDKPKGKRVRLVSWVPHGTWSWLLAADTCSICRNSLMSVCIECASAQDPDHTRKCTVTWGQCDHAFHSHCINKWLQQRSSCPIDNSNWSTKQISSAINS